MKAAILVAIMSGTAVADTVPLSSLATHARLQQHVTLPASVKITRANAGEYTTIAPPYCLVSDFPEHWTSGADDLDMDRRGASGWITSRGIERLIVRDNGDAELERTQLDPDLTPIERGHIPLHRVASIDEHHAVYAYHFHDQVFVIAESTSDVLLRFDSEGQTSGRGVTRAQNCGYAITQVRIAKGSSQAAQISGGFDTQHYLIDTSITQTSRDPEPLLSVTARVIDVP